MQKLQHSIYFLVILAIFNARSALGAGEKIRNSDTVSHIGAMHDTSKEGTAEITAKAYAYRYPQAPLDVEAYPVAPDNLELEQVYVYVRHGV